MAQQLPKIVQSASGKSYDSSSPQGKMIVNSPNYKNPFDKQSSALAPMSPEGSSLATMGPMESIQAIFSNMADSLESIKDSAISLVMAEEGDARGDALAGAAILGGTPIADAFSVRETINPTTSPSTTVGTVLDVFNQRGEFVKQISSRDSVAFNEARAQGFKQY